MGLYLPCEAWIVRNHGLCPISHAVICHPPHQMCKSLSFSNQFSSISFIKYDIFGTYILGSNKVLQLASHIMHWLTLVWSLNWWCSAHRLYENVIRNCFYWCCLRNGPHLVALLKASSISVLPWQQCGTEPPNHFQKALKQLTRRRIGCRSWILLQSMFYREWVCKKNLKSIIICLAMTIW